eukprot:836691-Alexandrium_andersonii.AAC.1
MSASLVGSEMCIRDSRRSVQRARTVHAAAAPARRGLLEPRAKGGRGDAQAPTASERQALRRGAELWQDLA